MSSLLLAQSQITGNSGAVIALPRAPSSNAQERKTDVGLARRASLRRHILQHGNIAHQPMVGRARGGAARRPCASAESPIDPEQNEGDHTREAPVKEHPPQCTPADEVEHNLWIMCGERERRVRNARAQFTGAKHAAGSQLSHAIDRAMPMCSAKNRSLGPHIISTTGAHKAAHADAWTHLGVVVCDNGQALVQSHPCLRSLVAGRERRQGRAVLVSRSKPQLYLRLKERGRVRLFAQGIAVQRCAFVNLRVALCESCEFPCAKNGTVTCMGFDHAHRTCGATSRGHAHWRDRNKYPAEKHQQRGVHECVCAQG